MSDTPDNRLEVLKKAILDLTIEHWQKFGKALLLASLGQALGKSGYNIKVEIPGQKLRSFIQTEMIDKVTVVTSPFDRLVYGIVPTKDAAGKKPTDLFVGGSEGAKAPKLNFDRRVLIAFSRPIETNRVRILHLEPELNFEDIPAESIPAGARLVIPPNLIVPPGSMPSGSRNAELRKNIQDWFKTNSADISKVEAKHHGEYGIHVTDNSILSLMFRTLDKKDLERIVIPLDIVAKLLSRGPKND